MNYTNAIRDLVARTLFRSRIEEKGRCWWCGEALDNHLVYCRVRMRAQRILDRQMREILRDITTQR